MWEGGEITKRANKTKLTNSRGWAELICRGLILLVAVVIPRRFRADWRREWVAELRYQELVFSEWKRLTWRTRLELLWRSAGALVDALWMQSYRWEDEMIQDLRFGVRMLLKNKAFTVVALLTLALGIGANTAIFSVVDAVLLKPLPFKNPEEVITVWNVPPASVGAQAPIPMSDLIDWRAQSKSFAEMGAFMIQTFHYTGGDAPERIPAVEATANFLSIFGINPQLGRGVFPEEEKPGAPRVALIGDRFWRNRLGADPNVVGRSITLNGESYSVIGVLPAALDFPFKVVELWTNLRVQPPPKRGPHFLLGIGRLKPGVNLEQARAEMAGVVSSFSKEPIKFVLKPIEESLVGEIQPAIWALFGAVSLVLLIAAVNVANLMLIRSAARTQEMTVRAALGASRTRIVRQLLTESFLLVVAGLGLGLLLAWAGVRLLTRMAPQNLPRLDQIGLDGRVLAWAAIVSLLTGLVFGLAPAWQSSRLSLIETLKEGGRGSGESVGKRRWRNLLAVSELALAVTLLIGAGLLVKSLWRLENVEIGVSAERVMTTNLALRGERYRDPQQIQSFCRSLLEKVKALPGVKFAALSNGLPPSAAAFMDHYQVDGRSYGPNLPDGVAVFQRVSPEYFRLLGVPLHQGRYFEDRDDEQAPRAVIISDMIAREMFPKENPLGKQIVTVGAEPRGMWEIVGVVGDVKYSGLAGATKPTLYQPLRQATSGAVFLSVKSEALDPLSLASVIRQEIKHLDPELPATKAITLEDMVDGNVAEPRFRAMLIGGFAALALLLAVIGVYSVMSYSVVQRFHEIGVRIALGASTRDILKLILRQGATLAMFGAVIGVGGAFLLTRVLNTLLFSVSPTDPWIFAAIPLALILAALAAGYLPARRATKIDPATSLRAE